MMPVLEGEIVISYCATQTESSSGLKAQRKTLKVIITGKWCPKRKRCFDTVKNHHAWVPPALNTIRRKNISLLVREFGV